MRDCCNSATRRSALHALMLACAEGLVYGTRPHYMPQVPDCSGFLRAVRDEHQPEVCDTRLKKITILFSILGLALLTGATAWVGAGAVARAVVSIGLVGFVATVACQLGTDLVLGVAWRSACRGIGTRHLTMARIVRDAAASCLPFSTVGGILIGMRATCRPQTGRRRAVEWPEAASANVVDITTEVLGQIVFVLLGVVCLAGHQGSDRFVGPVVLGTVLLAFGIAGFIWTQQSGGTLVRRIATFLGKNIASQWQHVMMGGVGTIQERLEETWSHPGRIAAAASLHLVGWICSAGTIWVAYRFLGAHLSLTNAIAIEGVTCGIMSASFLVPAGLGVQEAAYMTLGSAFGIDPSISVGLSLLRRGRDLVIGVPALLIWQAGEMRRARYRRSQELQTAYAPPAIPERRAS